MKIELDSFGSVICKQPSLSTCFDLVSMWSENQNRSTMGRICAMAICICADSPTFPKIKYLTNVQEYGSKCLDFLLGAGIPVDEILHNGVQCIGMMATALPSKQEVDEVENFTEPPNPETSSG